MAHGSKIFIACDFHIHHRTARSASTSWRKRYFCGCKSLYARLWIPAFYAAADARTQNNKNNNTTQKTKKTLDTRQHNNSNNRKNTLKSRYVLQMNMWKQLKSMLWLLSMPRFVLHHYELHNLVLVVYTAYIVVRVSIYAGSLPACQPFRAAWFMWRRFNSITARPSFPAECTVHTYATPKRTQIQAYPRTHTQKHAYQHIQFSYCIYGICVVIYI